MSPVLGIIASSNQQGRAGGPVSAFDVLGSVVVPSGGLASITFAGIPTGYQHLQIRITARGTTATTWLQHNMTINGISTGYYAMHEIYGDGATAGGNADAATGYMSLGLYPGANQLANAYGATIVDLLDYNNTNKNKVARTLWGTDLNGSGFMDFRSSLFMNTSVINTLTITASSNNYTQNSSFALYGVK
jgi:hypothetical protein